MRLTEFIHLVNSKPCDLQEDVLDCTHLDIDKYWPDIIEARQLNRKREIIGISSE